MPKLQSKNGSFMLALPPIIAKFLEAEKGSELEYKITKTGRVEIVKVKEESK